MNGSHRREMWKVGLVSLSGVCLGIVILAGLNGAGMFRRANYSQADTSWRPPTTLSELVAGQKHPISVIAVAVVSRVQMTGTFPMSTIDPAIWGSPGPDDHYYEEMQGPEFTRWEMNAERVLLNDGSIGPGRPLVIERDAPPDGPGPDNYPAEKVGDRYLYFLAKGKDCASCPDVYASTEGPYSRLKIGGSQVTYSDGLDSPVAFAEGTPPADFVNAVATEVAIQHGTATP